MRKTATLFFALSIIILGSTGAFAQKRLLENTSWKLVEANGKRFAGSSAAISFGADAASFSGSTGCNAMSGRVDVRGKNIDFGVIRTTKRMCKLMAGSVDEGEVLSALENARRFDVRGDALRLYDRRGRTLIRLTRGLADQNDTDSSQLDDRKWVLEQIKGRQTFVALPYAFVNFDSRKGSAGGDTSCNVFGGNYKTSGSTITFSNIISTMRACTEDDKMSVEREFLDGLRQTNRYEIRDGRLKLYRGNEILLTFRGENK